ncbi:MAG: hypothetical protein ACJ72Z_07240, partial [Pyrinomonadaceae bacterium]
MNIALFKVRGLVFLSAVATFGFFIFGLSGTPQSARERTKTGYLPKAYSKSDAVTREIRNGSRSLLKFRVENGADRDNALKLGRLVADQGSYLFVSVSNSVAPPNGSQRVETTISLPGKHFDPIENPPSGSVPPGVERSPQGEGYYIVQFGITATDELLDSLKATGVEVLQYIPHQAFFVYGSGEAISRAAAHSRVRWVGSVLPEYKLSAPLKEQLASARQNKKPADGIEELELTRKSRAVFDIAVFKRANIKDVADRIATLGGQVTNE